MTPIRETWRAFVQESVSAQVAEANAARAEANGKEDARELFAKADTHSRAAYAARLTLNRFFDALEKEAAPA